MKVATWAEIRRLREVEGLSQRAIATKLRCSWRTVRHALQRSQPPQAQRRARRSLLDPHKPKIDALLAKYPALSAVRILEEIRKGPAGYSGQITLVRQYVSQVRPVRRRVYQEVHYEPGQAMQVDWGCCGLVRMGNTLRKVSVFVAVLCYSRLTYLEFFLSQRKPEFYRGIVHALEYFGGSPRRMIVDNLKAAVINGAGREACFHPEFLALCGHYYVEPIACEARDPESKGVVEGTVRYIKRNALTGRDEQLACWPGFIHLAAEWPENVANVRIHRSTRERPRDRLQHERTFLRRLTWPPFDTDEVVPVVVNSHARVHFDGNRYSVPPALAQRRATATLRANTTHVRLLFQGEEVACHPRCYERQQLIVSPAHHAEALKMRSRLRARDVENAFDALGPAAQTFHLQLRQRPVKTTVHLRRLLNLVRLYGRAEVLAAMQRATTYQTFDAAYVETILLQERRRRELPSPTIVRPKRPDLLEETDLEEPDPARYDRFCAPDEEREHE